MVHSQFTEFQQNKKNKWQLRQLLQERSETANRRRTRTAEEEWRVSKHEVIVAKLKRRENAQNL